MPDVQPDPHAAQPPSLSRAIDVGISGALYAWIVVAFNVVLVTSALSLSGRDWMPIVLILAGIPAVLVGLLAAYGSYRGGLEGYRSRMGLCVRCGYDLRASVDRCPECGRLTRNTRKGVRT